MEIVRPREVDTGPVAACSTIQRRGTCCRPTSRRLAVGRGAWVCSSGGLRGSIGVTSWWISSGSRSRSWIDVGKEKRGRNKARKGFCCALIPLGAFLSPHAYQVIFSTPSFPGPRILLNPSPTFTLGLALSRPLLLSSFRCCHVGRCPGAA